MRVRVKVRREQDMKRKLIIWCLAVGLAGSALAQKEEKSKPAGASAPVVEAAKTNAVLGVEKLMKDVDRYRGPVQVEGVVSAVSATNQTLALIDVREFQECGLAKCAELTLPVRWTGAMPTVGQAVRAAGEVQKSNGKLVFAASAVEKVPLPEKKK